MAGRKCTGSSTCGNHHRESGYELRKLEAELRNAYTMKMLKTQIAVKNTNLLFEEIRQKFQDKMMMNNIEVEIKEKSENEKKDYLQKCEKYKNELENQIQLKQEEKQKIKKNERMERRALEEVDRIREEEEEFQKLINNFEWKEKIERNYLIHMEINEILKRKKEDFDKDEDERVRKYTEVLEQRNLLVKKQEEEKIRKREEAIHLVAGMIIAAESTKQEREELIADLVAEEIQFQEMIREKEKSLKRMRMKDDLITVLDMQVLFNEECKRRFVEKDREFVEVVMKRILEDERMERLTLEARKRKYIKYQEDLLQLIEEKKLLRDKHIVQIQKEFESEQLQEKTMRNSIRDERISLLEHHMGSVAEFINRSKLTEEEQQILTECLKNRIS